MADNIKIEERVLDGDLVGPVNAEIDTKEFTGTVSLENSLLDGSGSEINVELSESMEVVGIDDLVEVKSEIDKSVSKAESSVAESQRQIDKANETIRNLDAISGQITNLVDTAKQAAATADNRAHDAQTSETNAAGSASSAKSSQAAAKRSQDAAKASQTAAKASETEAKAQAVEAAKQATAATAQATIATDQAKSATASAAKADAEQKAALAAQKAAEKARDQAGSSAGDASQSAGNAYRSQQLAKASEDKANQYQADAAKSSAEAAASASSMTQSVTDANAAKIAAEAAQLASENARDVSTAKSVVASQKAAAASTSADAAKASQDAAKASQDAAKISETNAKNSEAKAKTSETNAKTSETNAKSSQTAAANSAKASDTSAKASQASQVAASKSASQAAASKQAAAASASASEQSAQESENSNQASQTAQTNAEVAQAAAEAARDAAKVSETNAKSSETKASTAATTATSRAAASSNSAKAAATSANQAAQSKNAAKVSETNAKSSETKAKSSEDSAATSASNAADANTKAMAHASDALAAQLEAEKARDTAIASKNAAKSSETKAAASASAAKTSQSAAKSSETKAAASVSSAANSASAAKNSADDTASSASEAKTAEVAAKKSRDEAESFAIELRKGSVYRGTWNPNSGSYPKTPVTNSRWDVQLNAGQLEKVFDGKTWNWGDRLVYILDEKKFDIIDSGTGVTSVNGETGAVTVTPQSIGAARKTGEVFTGNVEITHGGDAAFSVNGGTNKNAELSLTEANGYGTYIAYQGKDTNETHYGTINKGNKAPFMIARRGQNFPIFIGIPRVSVAQSSAGNSLIRRDWAQDTFLSKAGGTVSGGVEVTGNVTAGTFKLRGLTTSNKEVLKSAGDKVNVGNDSLDTVNILGTKLTHNDATIYTEKNKPTPYDLGAVAQGDGWKKYSKIYNVNKDIHAVLLNIEDKPLEMADKSYYIRAYTVGTGTFTGAVYYLKGFNQVGGSTGTTNLTLVARQGSGSNHPEVFLDKGVPKLRTGHDKTYRISVIIEEVDNDCNPWLDLTSAYSPINRMPWNKLKDIPTAATRWPSFNEVTGKPSKYPTDWDNVSGKPAMATRWPTWAEVGGNSYIKAVDTHLQVGSNKWLRASDNDTGFLPASPNTTGKSTLGTSGWWFATSYIAKMFAKGLDIVGNTKLNGDVHVVSNNGVNGLKVSRYTNPAVEYMNIRREDTTTYFDNFEDSSEADTVYGGFSFRGGQKDVNNDRLTELFYFSNQSIRYKGQDIYHTGNKPTPADIGALPENGTANNANHLESKTLAQVIADARNGLANTDYAYSKASADARFFRKGQDLRVGKSGEGILALDVGTNRNGTFYITEDNKQHGTYIRYQGATDNNTWFGTVNSGKEYTYMRVPRGSDQVIFNGSPRVSAAQSSYGDSLTRRDWVQSQLDTKASTSTATIGKVEMKAGSTIGGSRPQNASLVVEDTMGIDGNEVVSSTNLLLGTTRDYVDIRKGIETLARFSDTGLDLKSGTLKENGYRVYSNNNKPKIADLAQPDTVTKSLKLQANVWATLLTKSNLKESGVYQVLITYTSAGKGGVAYTQGYTGQFYWHAGNTNQDNVSEIPLHHMGHADSGEYIYLRTHAKPGNKGDHTVEIKCNRAYSAAVDFTVKLVKIM
ncbi:tail fiber protein [Vibrio phage VPT02]|nr:tail fiber protein [Vibrio phage VPT02]